MKEFFNLITKWVVLVTMVAFMLILAITLPIWVWSETANKIVDKMMNRVSEKIKSW